MKALVTGASGFLGKQVVGHLLKAGIETRCLIRSPSAAKELGELAQGFNPRLLQIHIGNLCHFASCQQAIQDRDVVFHVAAALRGAAAVVFMNNVIATRNLFRAIQGSNVSRFVLVSSLGVYGTAHLQPYDTLDELCPLDPEPHRRDVYTYSKIAQENAAREASQAQQVPLVVVRPAVIYGPGRDMICNRVGIRLGTLILRMGGWQRLPYTHVKNCAQAVFLAGTVPGIEGQAFNIVDDDLPTGRQILKHSRKIGGKLRVLPVPYWAISPLSRICQWYHTWSSGQLPAILTPYKSMAQWKPLSYVNTKAKELLGWHPCMAFPNGLEDTVDLPPSRARVDMIRLA